MLWFFWLNQVDFLGPIFLYKYLIFFEKSDLSNRIAAIVLIQYLLICADTMPFLGYIPIDFLMYQLIGRSNFSHGNWLLG